MRKSPKANSWLKQCWNLSTSNSAFIALLLSILYTIAMTNRKSKLDALLQPFFSDRLLHIATFATDADQDKLRTFMAYLHHADSSLSGDGTQYLIRTFAVIYYIGNNDAFLSEISLWDNTHVVHINKQLVKMSHGNDDTLSHSVENWLPFFIKLAFVLFV
jgi:hypothetical protein